MIIRHRKDYISTAEIAPPKSDSTSVFSYIESIGNIIKAMRAKVAGIAIKYFRWKSFTSIRKKSFLFNKALIVFLLFNPLLFSIIEVRGNESSNNKAPSVARDYRPGAEPNNESNKSSSILKDDRDIILIHMQSAMLGFLSGVFLPIILALIGLIIKLAIYLKNKGDE